MRALKFASILLCVILLQSCNQPPNWNACNITGVMPDVSDTDAIVSDLNQLIDL